MQSIKIIHIDDHIETLAYCKKVIISNPHLKYCGGFTNANDAIDFLIDEKIDLIFCDIEMPEHNGIWLANHLPYTLPIIFLTAHAGFAVEAFEACALHYLIKPLSAQQLNTAIERFKNQELKHTHQGEQISQLYNQYLPQNTHAYPTRVYINNIGKIIIINLQDLLYMVGSGNYTKFIMLDGEVHTSSKNLKVYTDAIAHHPNFVRIHRSYLVNKNFVKQIHKTNNQQWFVQMTNNEKLELSKGRIDEILEQLQN